ncbi:MAG: NAD(P)-binding domain-containing protein, partial [Acidimicrobiia bacterium]|nr:NAD(P)-binding domain-containing protein [Acidimicrobiia bacterium]
MTVRPSVAVLGVGAIGEALVMGLLAAGWAPSDLSLCVRRPNRVDELVNSTGAVVGLD